jgi:hypothetical protein
MRDLTGREIEAVSGGIRAAPVRPRLDVGRIVLALFSLLFGRGRPGDPLLLSAPKDFRSARKKDKAASSGLVLDVHPRDGAG